MNTKLQFPFQILLLSAPGEELDAKVQREGKLLDFLIPGFPRSLESYVLGILFCPAPNGMFAIPLRLSPAENIVETAWN